MPTHKLSFYLIAFISVVSARYSFGHKYYFVFPLFADIRANKYFINTPSIDIIILPLPFPTPYPHTYLSHEHHLVPPCL